MPSGRLEHFLDWWVVLRSLLDCRRAHTSGAVTFHDRDGDPLDPRRTFRPERRVLYTDFSLPGGRHDAAEAVLRRIREGAPTTVSQRPAPPADHQISSSSRPRSTALRRPSTPSLR